MTYLIVYKFKLFDSSKNTLTSLGCQTPFLVTFHSSLDIVGNAMTTTTGAAKLTKHRFPMWYTMTALAGRYLAMNRVAKSTGLVGMSVFTVYQLVIHISMTATTNFFRFSF